MAEKNSKKSIHAGQEHSNRSTKARLDNSSNLATSPDRSHQLLTDIRDRLPYDARFGVSVWLDSMDQMIQKHRSTRRKPTPKSRWQKDLAIMERVEAEGVPFIPQNLPAGKGFCQGTLGDCFWNCLMRSLEHELIYVEGFASVNYGALVHHAWCVDEKDFVYEFTWPQIGSAYIGIPFPEDEVRRHLGVCARRHWVGPLLNEWIAKDSGSV